MQLPDEAIEFNYTGAPGPARRGLDPVAELQAKNYLAPERVDAIKQQLMQVRQQVAAERQMAKPAAEDAAARQRLHRPAAAS